MPTKLKEIKNVRQVPGERPRRWFTSTTMDLVVWCDEADCPIGFQFCYDKGNVERALVWDAKSGFAHMTVDDGEASGGMYYKATPILVADGRFDAVRVSALFEADSVHMPIGLKKFIAEKINSYA